jgi:hypothetical protein
LIVKASNRSKPQPSTKIGLLPTLTDDGNLLDVLEAVLVEPVIDSDLNKVGSGLEETIGTQSTGNDKGLMNPESLRLSSGGPLVLALEAPGNQRTSKTDGGSLYVAFIILCQISSSRLWPHMN